jgi:hypothetical protein
MKQITCPHCGDTYPDFDAAHVCSKGPYAPRLKPKMNERIRQLAEQALNYAEKNQSADIPQHWFKLHTEKFAELIVKECAAIVWNDKDSQRMLKHFGVEE